ncbi:MAG: glycosyltransferase family 2 protein [Pasteurellaceae bacterium]|nr:glycosyltransferase family 2 protein [Pasteurellaceae bacterium]
MKTINPIAIIPHYNHSSTVGKVAEQLNQFGLPVLIVDDGSSPEHQQALQKLPQTDRLQIYFRPENGGKGAAMKSGFQLAFEQGFSHAVQVDADGQHHLPDVETMLELAQKSPNAMICGKPIYGEDAPKARLYGRKITDFWNAINTLSVEIKDGMCGFRIYPLAQIMPILSQEKIGDRMDFDTEILVHSHWRKIPFIWFDTPVRYAQNGISHFRGWADNWLISKMHARLFFGMLTRLFCCKRT